jgi:hypothetical protein
MHMITISMFTTMETSNLNVTYYIFMTKRTSADGTYRNELLNSRPTKVNRKKRSMGAECWVPFHSARWIGWSKAWRTEMIVRDLRTYPGSQTVLYRQWKVKKLDEILAHSHRIRTTQTTTEFLNSFPRDRNIKQSCIKRAFRLVFRNWRIMNLTTSS